MGSIFKPKRAPTFQDNKRKKSSFSESDVNRDKKSGRFKK